MSSEMNVFHQIATLSLGVLILSDAYVCRLIVPQSRDQSTSAYPETLYMRLNSSIGSGKKYSDETRRTENITKTSMDDKNWPSTSNENYKSLSTTKNYQTFYDNDYSTETNAKNSSVYDKNWQNTSSKNYKSLSTTKKYQELYNDSTIANPSKSNDHEGIAFKRLPRRSFDPTGPIVPTSTVKSEKTFNRDQTRNGTGAYRQNNEMPSTTSLNPVKLRSLLPIPFIQAPPFIFFK